MTYLHLRTNILMRPDDAPVSSVTFVRVRIYSAARFDTGIRGNLISIVVAFVTDILLFECGCCFYGKVCRELLHLMRFKDNAKVMVGDPFFRSGAA